MKYIIAMLVLGTLFSGCSERGMKSINGSTIDVINFEDRDKLAEFL